MVDVSGTTYIHCLDGDRTDARILPIDRDNGRWCLEINIDGHSWRILADVGQLDAIVDGILTDPPTGATT